MILILFLMIIFILSGLGWASLIKRLDIHFMDENYYGLIRNIALGFVVSYSIFFVIYFSCIGISQRTSLTLLSSLLAIQVLAGIVLGFSLLNFKSILIRQDIIFLAIVLICIVLPQLALGSKPIVVSDSWSHITIINRMLQNNEIVLNSFSMPNDHYLLRFSPHHAFLAVVAHITASSPLEVYTAARLIYPIIATSAFLYAISKISSKDISTALILVGVIVFALTYPTTDGIWRGSADYKISAAILMFFLVGFLTPYFRAEQKFNFASAVLGATITLSLALTHAVEIAILTLMIIPIGAIQTYQSFKKSWSFLAVSLSLIIFIISGLLALISSKTISPLPLDTTLDYLVFLKNYLNQLNTHITIITWWCSVILLLLIWRIKENRSHYAVIFLITSLLSSLAFGPLNPVIYPAYAKLMSATLSTRTMYAFPFYFVFIYALTHLKSLKIARWYGSEIIIITISLLGIFYNFYKKSGLDGEFSYRSSDSVSQLNLYPNFYEEIKNHFTKNIILSDTFTSAPITAISNNYIFTNRPWTGGNNGRYYTAASIMRDPLSLESKKEICKGHIDLIAINGNAIPISLRNTFSLSPWIFDDFRPNISIRHLKMAKGFIWISRWDGIDVFRIDRNLLCNR